MQEAVKNNDYDWPIVNARHFFSLLFSKVEIKAHEKIEGTHGRRIDARELTI